MVSTSILVLVVEDNLLMQAVIQDAFTDAGYDVVVAGTGNEAIEKLNAIGANIGALVTDVDLASEKLTGWDVARHARETISELPVVYMTGASGADWSSKGVVKSILVPKPFAPGTGGDRCFAVAECQRLYRGLSSHLLLWRLRRT